MPISTRQFVGSTLALLAIGFFALCAILGTNIWLGERARIYSRQVIEARDVKAIAVDLRAALQTAESSERGYLYTGNEIYLAPYDLAKDRARAAAKELPSLVSSYRSLEPAVTRLLVTIDAKVAEMDEVNLFISGIVLAADQKLAALVEEQSENALLLRLVSVIGSLVILAAAAAGIFTIVRYTRELNLAHNELAAANDKLEIRVAARTKELAVANTEMRDARDRARTLLAEVNHRVANSLALVVSLIGLQTRTLQNAPAKAALDEARARVQAIAMVHRRLYDDGDVREVALDEYLASLLEQFRTTVEAAEGITLKYEFEPLKLKTDASISLGVVVTEWVMNAFKYAYPNRTGEVRVILSSNGDGFGILRVEDDGIGRDDEVKPKGTGVGTRIVNAMASSMGATIEYVAKSPGTSARFSFPLAAK